MIKDMCVSTKAAKSPTVRLINKMLVLVSDTREACRSAAPGHQTGMDREQVRSVNVSNRGCGRLRGGEMCFQFLS
jgi:hypothetical protein